MLPPERIGYFVGASVISADTLPEFSLMEAKAFDMI
jgi:hypothetical protein